MKLCDFLSVFVIRGVGGFSVDVEEFIYKFVLFYFEFRAAATTLEHGLSGRILRYLFVWWNRKLVN